MLASSWLFTVSPSSTPCSAYITSIYLKSITLRKLMMMIVVVMLCLGLIQHCTRIALQRCKTMEWNAFRCVRGVACVNKSCRTADYIGQRLTSSKLLLVAASNSSGKHYVIASFTNQATKPSLTGRAQHHIAVLPIEYVIYSYIP